MKPLARISVAAVVGITAGAVVVATALLAGFSAFGELVLMSGTPTARVLAQALPSEWCYWLTGDCGPVGTVILFTVSAGFQLAVVFSVVVFVFLKYRAIDRSHEWKENG